ncbi:metalloprotease m41 [Sporothrix brasiliensis 5110]|uniref:Metalloprotease m41 n=1 Tax=Sporothrix brasiliensis 5110 TaxID=1398154 RepID=A0A0C2IW04_9PEZI|nr:metalloprotease m41 [Sporothrix brasiliensis 5110]KIH93336.1 metalloprotease m41 [Sporothrix brasiliensis 5110]
MPPPTVQDLLRQLEQERREKAEVQARAERAEARAGMLETRAGVLETRQSPSSFLDYVRWTEKVLFQTFHIKPALVPQSERRSQAAGTSASSPSTTHTATRVKGKFYPRRLRPWDFETAHASIFQTLVAAFGEDKVFPALTDVIGIGRDLSPGPADEQDLRPFIRAAIEKPAARVVTQYIQQKQNDKASTDNERGFLKITFQNNAYGVDLVQEAAEETPPPPPPGQPGVMAPPPKRRRSPVKTIGVPDRWCVGFDDSGSATHILVGEYKAAHKLPAQKLSAVLSKPPGEDFFIQAVKSRDVDPNATDATAPTSAAAAAAATQRRAAPVTGADVEHTRLTSEEVYIASTLCQAYHYMITTGLEFGYVASGDGLVFLRVLEDDPQTLLYFWSVFPVQAPAPGQGAAPGAALASDDIENSTAGMREPIQTALAYLTSLCMLALKSTVRPMSWIDARERDLARWPHPYEQALPSMATAALLPAPPGPRRDDTGGGAGGTGSSGGSGSEPSRTSTKRPHSAHTPSRTNTGSGSGSASASGNGSGNGNTARTRFVVEPPTLPYCTQACLRGLCTGAPLDDLCPNAALHRAARPPQAGTGHGDGHPLTADGVRERIVAQLAQNMDKDCQCLDRWGFFGRYGALFKLAVTGYGYTFVAKGVQAPHRHLLEDEAAVYTALAAHQGRLIPVFLGIADLARPLPLQSLARVPHLLLLSYAGPLLSPDDTHAAAERERTVAELQAAGLYNDDVHAGNMAWNAEAGRVMLFDFDQACVYQRPQQPEHSEPSAIPPPSPPATKRSFTAYSGGATEGRTTPSPKRLQLQSA